MLCGIQLFVSILFWIKKNNILSLKPNQMAVLVKIWTVGEKTAGRVLKSEFYISVSTVYDSRSESECL